MEGDKVPKGSPLGPVNDSSGKPTYLQAQQHLQQQGALAAAAVASVSAAAAAGGGGGGDRMSVESTGSANSIRTATSQPNSPPAKGTYQQGAAYNNNGGGGGAPRYTPPNHRDRSGTSATTQTLTTDSTPMYRCNAVNKDGQAEVFCDWANIPFCAATYGNVAHLCDTIAPMIPAKVTTNPDGTSVSSFRLCELWRALDNPYAFEVPLHPIQLAPHKPAEAAVYYTPSLSGFQLYCSVDSQGAMNDICANSWFATEKPELRPSVLDQVEQLRGDFPDLWSKKNTDFAHKSWFALLWQPVFCHNHSSQWSAGTFLSMHFINPIHPAHSTPRSSVVRCDRFVDADIWTCPHSRLRMNRGFTPPATDTLTCPVFGLVSQRARSDVWYVPTDGSNTSYLTPLFLLAAAVQLMSWLEDNDPSWGSKNLADYYHLTKHERNHGEFVSNFK